MREWTVNSSGVGQQVLYPNLTTAEQAGYPYSVNSTGFGLTGVGAGNIFVYIAIRRGPMKTPTVGTSVFSPNVATTQILTNTVLPSAGFPVDLMFFRKKDDAYSTYWNSRLLPDSNLQANDTAAEITGYPYSFASMTAVTKITNNWFTGTAVPFVFWQFRRTPGFFDEVCYTGTGGSLTLTHNLGVVPELAICKSRSAADNWEVAVVDPSNPSQFYVGTNADRFGFNLTNGYGASPFITSDYLTATTFKAGTWWDKGVSARTYVAYLFATVAGVSKVGSYTGNGSSQTIACGFTAGSRFVLIKRTNTTGDWYVWDSARGIVAGNDPHLSLNTTAAEVTTDDSVDTDNSGFIVNQDAATNINVTSATYIFLAIA